MCGIFGVMASERSARSETKFFINSLKFLAKVSQSRGRDSSGICILDQVSSDINIFKGPMPARQLFKSKDVMSSISRGFTNVCKSSYAFGHARLVTNGTQLNINNNPKILILIDNATKKLNKIRNLFCL